MAELLKGKAAADAITEDLKLRCTELKENGMIPCLAIVRVGEKADDVAYEKGAMKRCEKIGIEVRNFLLPENASKAELLNVIEGVNRDPSIHGCLMFRPLKDKEAEREACALLDSRKDVDAMTLTSLAGVFTGNGQGYPPCTAEAVIELLDYYKIPLEGKRVTVIGRSMVIGKPVSMLLQKRNATVTMCHTRTVDLPAACRNAEILVSAAGHAGTVNQSHVCEGQVVVDVGINLDEEGRLCGDVQFDEVKEIVSAISPVPGGVGSVTTAVLAKHVIEAAGKSRER